MYYNKKKKVCLIKFEDKCSASDCFKIYFFFVYFVCICDKLEEDLMESAFMLLSTYIEKF